jgi:predicted dehydrogenase
VPAVTVRVGFLGAGFIATYHAWMLATSGAAASMAGVFDPDRDRAERFSRDHGARVHPSVEALLDAVDAVYVCTWTSEHRHLVGEAAARGLPLFCEKPLATDLADATDLVASVHRAGVVNQVGLVLRDAPACLLVRSLVGDPDAGRVMSVVFRDDQYLPVEGMYGSTWRADAARAGSGTLLEHSIHDLDLLEWWCGPVTSVCARTAQFHPHEGIEDVAVGLLAFESGATGSLTSVWHDVVERPSLRRVEIFCERRWIALEGDLTGPVRWQQRGGPAVAVEGEELSDELARRGIAPRNPDGAFIAAVLSGTPASPDLATALRAHVLADACYRSAASGGAPVEVGHGAT